MSPLNQEWRHRCKSWETGKDQLKHCFSHMPLQDSCNDFLVEREFAEGKEGHNMIIPSNKQNGMRQVDQSWLSSHNYD